MLPLTKTLKKICIKFKQPTNKRWESNAEWMKWTKKIEIDLSLSSAVFITLLLFGKSRI